MRPLSDRDGPIVDIANEKGAFDGDIAIVKPIEYGNPEAFKEQGCVYNVLLRGKNEGRAGRQVRQPCAHGEDCQ